MISAFCMCVVNKQFELLEFVFDYVYVDLQYDEMSLTFTSGSVCLCDVCSPVVVIGVVVVVPYVVSVDVAATVMHVMICVLRGCGNAGVRSGRGVDAASA